LLFVYAIVPLEQVPTSSSSHDIGRFVLRSLEKGCTMKMNWRQHPGVWILIVLNAAVPNALLMHLLLAMPVICART